MARCSASACAWGSFPECPWPRPPHWRARRRTGNIKNRGCAPQTARFTRSPSIRRPIAGRWKNWPSGAGSSVRSSPSRPSRPRRASFWRSPGSAHLFGGEQSLAEQILRALGWRGLIGPRGRRRHFRRRLGRGPFYGRSAKGQSHFRSDHASHGARLRMVPEIGTVPGTVPQFNVPALHHSARPEPPLAPRSAHRALRLPDDVIDLLHPLGIYRIGQLEQLPRADLAARFRTVFDRAMGSGRRPAG